MSQSIPFTFATQSGNVPASELDNNFTAVQTSLTSEASVSGASLVNLGAQVSNNIVITGNSATITSFGSSAITTQPVFFIRFTGTGNTISYNATSMITPGAANIAVGANDAFKCVYLGSGNWLVEPFLNASGITPGTYGNVTVNAMGQVTATTAGSSGALVLIQTKTASNSTTIDFTSIPGTYSQYELSLTNVI